MSVKRMADKESNNCEVNREVRHLVSMANDIADNLGFRAEAGDNSAERIADHINRFWAPRMRALLLEYAAADGKDLSAALLSALEKLKT